MPEKYQEYERASSADDDHPLLGRDANAASRKHLSNVSSWRWILLAVSCGCGCFLSAFLGVVAAARWLQPATAATCTELVAHHSPVTEDIPISYHTVTFEGSFMNENIYRQQGSPEVDAAWEALGVDYRPMSLPAEVAERAGVAKDSAHIREQYGGGYPVNLEGLHHLHCLNLVRKALWFNYDYYHNLGDGAFVNNDVVIRKHVTHCLDIVRQQLMCTVDIGVLGQVWWRNSTMEEAKPFVDFNTQHVCRNYDEIREWARVRQLPKHAPKDFLIPPKEGDTVYDSIP